ncbi:hypothetical protein C7S13_4307 [Burkholderia cepacia]|nr:hypothetical protein [Burkholderia cepacia]
MSAAVERHIPASRNLTHFSSRDHDHARPLSHTGSMVRHPAALIKESTR